MTNISAFIKGYVKIDIRHLAKSKVKFEVLHVKGWQPLFEFTAEDMIKLFKRNRRVK